ncbi:MAG: DegV family protein [Anaerolineae bacterium]|nr:DegV family protein [Anaerolineae bacterium]
MVRVVTDSTADIPLEITEELGITVVPSYIAFGSETYQDGIDLTKQQFYDKLIASRVIPTTAAPPIGAYEKVFSHLAEEADEIISLQLVSRLSALYSLAVIAAHNVSQAMGVRIEVVDTGQITMGYGWMAVAAAEAARRGETLDQITALVEGMKPRARVLAILDTLEYVYRGGRTNWATAVIGTLLRFKPIVEVRLGQVDLVERTRTIERSLDRLIERIQAMGQPERAIVLHTNAPTLADRLAKRLQAIYPEWEPLIGQAGVTIASHAGPGAVGVACVSTS